MGSTYNEQADLHDWHWLASDAASAMLHELSDEPLDPLAMEKALRHRCTPSQRRLLLLQLALRQRAKHKFACANNMFFTTKGYEQSSDEWIAAYKAKRFVSCETTTDLCSGIGGDSIALAATSQLRAVDADPVVAWCASRNLHAYQRSGEVLAETGDDVHIRDAGAWHIDPDRRASGRRVSNLASVEPSQESLLAWLAINPNAAIKLAPATRFEEWPYELEREWIGRRGECRQQVAWHGKLMQSPGQRRATVLPADGGVPLASIVGTPSPPRFSPDVGEYVYDVDSTLLVAGLVGTLAQEFALTAWSSSEGYLTGAACSHTMLQAFRVEEVLPLRPATVADWLKQQSIGHVELKSRLRDFDHSSFLKKLRLRGEQKITLLVAAQGARRVAVAAHRITHGDPKR